MNSQLRESNKNWFLIEKKGYQTKKQLQYLLTNNQLIHWLENKER